MQRNVTVTPSFRPKRPSITRRVSIPEETSNHINYISNQNYPIPQNYAYPTRILNNTFVGNTHPCLLLENSDLWSQFHELQNEMIITRAGRCLFPTLNLRLINLDPTTNYSLFLDFAMTSTERFRFKDGVWAPWGRDPRRPDSTTDDVQHMQTGVYTHPNSPCLGSVWMQSSVSFNKVKLSNQLSSAGNFYDLCKLNEYSTEATGIFQLISFRKYCPRFHLIELGKRNRRATYQFEHTSFIAVTHYQNSKVNQLKKNYNPHAKGFRTADERAMQAKAGKSLPSFSALIREPSIEEEEWEDDEFDGWNEMDESIQSMSSESDRDLGVLESCPRSTPLPAEPIPPGSIWHREMSISHERFVNSDRSSPMTPPLPSLRASMKLAHNEYPCAKSEELGPHPSELSPPSNRPTMVRWISCPVTSAQTDPPLSFSRLIKHPSPPREPNLNQLQWENNRLLEFIRERYGIHAEREAEAILGMQVRDVTF
ncbi:uncharacterized protein VTP21DRAFT_10982 [Calcarisporiella thermophila]|uniref:uncharacterized protein n=1 Tax=Calcarisporiella thermophila TaxID=911321 RepID=UPI00374480C5